MTLFNNNLNYIAECYDFKIQWQNKGTNSGPTSSGSHKNWRPFSKKRVLF